MSLTPDQKQLAQTLVNIGRKRGAGRKSILAALETGLVESNLRNLNYGDADSQGWRQERTSLYPNPTNVKASANRFYSEIQALGDTKGMTAGQIAADVQRPAEQYRGRYQERKQDAVSLLNQLTGNAQPQGQGAGRQAARPVQDSSLVQQTSFDQAGYDKAKKLTILGQLLEKRDPNSNLLKLGVVPTEAPSRDDFQTTGLTVKSTSRPTQQRQNAGGRTLYVGDSLGEGTSPYLPNAVRDTKVGRTSAEGRRILTQKLTQGGNFGRIVLDLGTNDANGQELAKTIRTAQRLAPNAQIYVPLVNGPAADRKNAVIKRLAGGNVHAVQWSAPLADDGIHSTPQGYQQRARELKAAMGGGSAPEQLAGNLVNEVTRRASLIDAQQLPYQWGGGHDKKVTNYRKTAPLDCSGAVSAVLGIDPRVSGQFEKFGKPGAAPAGKGVTIYANDKHVLMRIGGRFFGTSAANPGGGAGWIPSSHISRDYLSGFTARHV